MANPWVNIQDVPDISFYFQPLVEGTSSADGEFFVISGGKSEYGYSSLGVEVYLPSEGAFGYNEYRVTFEEYSDNVNTMATPARWFPYNGVGVENAEGSPCSAFDPAVYEESVELSLSQGVAIYTANSSNGAIDPITNVNMRVKVEVRVGGSEPPTSDCFWTNKLGVSEDCGGGDTPVTGPTFFRTETTSDNAYNYPGGFNFVSNGDPCPFAPGVTFDLAELPTLLWIVGAWGTPFQAAPSDGTQVSCADFQAAIVSGTVAEFTAAEPVPIYMRHYGAGINHIVQGHDTGFYNPLSPGMLPDALGRPDWVGGLGANYLVGIVVSDGTTEYRILTTSTTGI